MCLAKLQFEVCDLRICPCDVGFLSTTVPVCLNIFARGCSWVLGQRDIITDLGHLSSGKDRLWQDGWWLIFGIILHHPLSLLWIFFYAPISILQSSTLTPKRSILLCGVRFVQHSLFCKLISLTPSYQTTVVPWTLVKISVIVTPITLWRERSKGGTIFWAPPRLVSRLPPGLNILFYF